jgi:TetR/AcrR family transcriptional regulator, transcriptional repressor of aconitase
MSIHPRQLSSIDILTIFVNNPDMTQTPLHHKNDKRRKAIIVAALKCFLQFGYAKTSMDDVAKEAKLSRPLIYLKFKNKEELYMGVVEYLGESRRPEVFEKILTSDQPRKIKLAKIYDAFLLEPWEKIIGKPMTADFYNVCYNLFPDVAERYKTQVLNWTQRVLIDKKISEIFVLSVEGLKSDLPDVKTLRSRLKILIDNFV